jgi:hypothetical protein
VRREEPQPQGLLSSSLLFKIVPTSLEQIIQGNEAQELPRFPLVLSEFAEVGTDRVGMVWGTLLA